MSLTKYINGIHAYIRSRDDIHFEAIAAKFNLDTADIRKAAYDAEDSIKKPKPIKVQTRQPKNNTNKDGTKAERKKSGYWYFSKEMRPTAVDLLINKPKERKFTQRDGKVVDIKVSDFKNDKPTFTHVNQKCAHMWWSLSDEERAEWEVKVAEYCEELKKKEKKEKDNEGSDDEGTEGDEIESDDEEEKESDDDEEEEEKPVPKKSAKNTTKVIAKNNGKGEGRTAKTLPVKKALPPPKGKVNAKGKGNK
jgi:hypothetical protein